MAIRKTRNVSLTPELERSVDEMVASGQYRSASEVVRAGLRLLEREQRVERRLRSFAASTRGLAGDGERRE
jgi:antitoxin ParD1/3/4